MARRTFRRRRFRPRRTVFSRTRRGRRYLKTIRKTVRRMAETKFVDGGGSGDVSTTPTIFQLSTIAQGTQDTQRLGDKVSVAGLRCRYSFECLEAETSGRNLIRIIIFQWKMDNTDIAPTAAQILQQGSTIPLYDFYHHDRHAKYSILYDKLHTLNIQDHWEQRFVNKKVNLKYMHRTMEYIAASSTAGLGQLYCMMVSDSAIAVHPTYTFDWRLTFKDI